MTTIKNKSYPSRAILIVDDDTEVLNTLKVTLYSSGYDNIILCNDPRQVFDILKKNNAGVMLLDLVMPHVRGEDILNQLMVDYPSISVIIISGINDIPSAVRCMREGAFDYIVKPIERETLLSSVRKAVSNYELQQENLELKDILFSDVSADANIAFSDIVTNNNMMKSIFRYCEAISHSSQPVLVTGETGTGKELIARAMSKLYNITGKFVPVNVAGLDDNMFSDTLFGHVKGAYTGASESRDGLVSKAENGILFLDEIGDLSLQSQIKLLRLLQEREYSPLGSDLSKRSNAKVILATNKELVLLMNSGRFRKDLYYRLSAHQIKIPPLRERLDDIPLLLNTFIREASKDIGIAPPTYHPDLITLLKSYHFPGNIRELQGMVYNAVTKHRSHMLSAKTFHEYIDDYFKKSRTGSRKKDLDEENDMEWVSVLQVLPSLKKVNELIINEALRRSDGNQRVASKLLGITPQALSKRLKKSDRMKEDG